MKPEIWMPILKAVGEVLCALWQDNDTDNEDLD